MLMHILKYTEKNKKTNTKQEQVNIITEKDE